MADKAQNPASKANEDPENKTKIEEEDEPGGFRDFLSNLYEEFFAYQTIKLVKMRDWRLGLLKRIFNLGIAVYILFFMVFMHGYLEFELPVVFVSPTFNDTLYIQAQALNLSKTKPLSYKYCGTADDVPPFEYKYGDSQFQNHDNISCVDYLTKSEFSKILTRRATLVTYSRVQEYNRTPECALKLNRFNTAPTECRQYPVGIEFGVHVKDVEKIQLVFTSGFTTSRGQIVTQAATTVQGESCRGLFSGASCVSKKFKSGEIVVLTVEDILEMANINFDAKHQDSGGFGTDLLTEDGTTINTLGWPSYRMTGMELAFLLEYTNSKTFKWFTGKAELVITVTYASPGSWRSTGTAVQYKGGDAGLDWPSLYDADDRFRFAKTYGMVFTFVSGGIIGTPTYGMFIFTLLSSLLLFAVATSGIDIIAALMIKGFKESKLEEDMELRMRQTLREVLGPVVPADLEVEVDEEQTASTATIANLFFCCKQDKLTDEEKRKAKVQAETLAAEAMLPEINAIVIDGEPYHGQLLRLYGKPKRTFSTNIQWQVRNVVGTMPMSTDEDDDSDTGSRHSGSGSERSAQVGLSGVSVGSNHWEQVSTADGTDTSTRKAQPSDRRKKKTGKHIYEWVNIPGSNSPELFASAEYVGKSIRVRVTPISKDGIKGITDTAKVSVVKTFPRVTKRVRHFNELGKLRFEVIVKPNSLTKTRERCFLTLDLKNDTLTIVPVTPSNLKTPNPDGRKRCVENLFKKDMSHDPPQILPEGDHFHKKKTKFEARLRRTNFAAEGGVRRATLSMSTTNHKMLIIDRNPPKFSAAHFECATEEERDIIYLLIVKKHRYRPAPDPNSLFYKPGVGEHSPASSRPVSEAGSE